MIASVSSGIPLYRVAGYFFSNYKLTYGVILALTLVASMLESLSVAAFFPLFSSILGSNQEDLGGILGFIIWATGLMPFSDSIVSAGVLLLVIVLVKTMVSLTRDILNGYASANAFYDVKNRIMDTYTGAHYQFFLDNQQGTLLYNSLAATNAVANLMLKVPQILTLLLKVVFVIAVLLTIFPLAAVAFGLFGLFYYGIMFYLSKRVSLNLGRGRARAGTVQNIIQNEFITGIHQIITFRATHLWAARFDEENWKHSRFLAKIRIWLAIPRPMIELSAVAMMIGFILILKLASPGNFVDLLPKVGVLAVSMFQLLPAISGIGRLRMELMGILPDLERVYDTVSGTVPQRLDGNRKIDSFKDSIRFENVNFSHKGRDALLEGVNLVFEKGKVTALVGPSGGGKTTVINMILGLFQPDGGQITVDGIPLNELQHEDWLGKIGFVSQEPFTYHASVVDNITFGRKGYSMESVVESAKIANAHGFISELPEGYDAMVGERGMKLSGGQQQRIAIARAALGSPEILIFDEATSSLDTVSERLVQEALDNVSVDRTVIVVAHRLSTIRHADKIIVIDNGHVVEEGSHEQLLRKQGDYSQMVVSAS